MPSTLELVPTVDLMNELSRRHDAMVLCVFRFHSADNHGGDLFLRGDRTLLHGLVSEAMDFIRHIPLPDGLELRPAAPGETQIVDPPVDSDDDDNDDEEPANG